MTDQLRSQQDENPPYLSILILPQSTQAISTMFITKNIFTQTSTVRKSTYSGLRSPELNRKKLQNLTLVQIYPRLHLLLIKALKIKITSFLSVEKTFPKIFGRNLELSENLSSAHESTDFSRPKNKPSMLVRC